MLCLSTHEDEDVVIDLRSVGLGIVEIKTLDIRGNKVRTGYTAGREVPIHRRSVFEQIEKERNGGGNGLSKAG